MTVSTLELLSDRCFRLVHSHYCISENTRLALDLQTWKKVSNLATSRIKVDDATLERGLASVDGFLGVIDGVECFVLIPLIRRQNETSRFPRVFSWLREERDA